jgi:hypothetical protein
MTVLLVQNLVVQEQENSLFKLSPQGDFVFSNAIDSIEKSHKIVFVLSESFVRSEWCKCKPALRGEQPGCHLHSGIH